MRLSFSETIEFGYDQPRLASRVIEYIENGKYADTQKFAEKSPWGNISWGPSLFFFYTPFFLISRDPLLISNLIASFNLLSILLVIFIGGKYFSKTVGLIAGLLLATQPWWFIFSRMIYQPTPLATIVSISMLLFMMTYKRPNSLWWSLLIFSWFFLIELYAHSVAFVGISFLLLLIFDNIKLFNKYLFLGLIISSVLIIPYFYNYNKDDYFPEKGIEKLQNGRDDYLSRFKNISTGYLSVLSGGSFEYQLGYGYGEFLNANKTLVTIISSFIYLTGIMLVVNLTSLFFIKKSRFLKLSLLLWSVSPIIFLTLVRLPSVPPIPRYFLVSFPPIVLLWGIFIDELKYKLFIAIPLFISFVWILLIYRYDVFIKNYDFSNGHLSVFSDTQYLFLKKSIDLIIDDSKSNKYSQIVISNDENNPKYFSLDWSTGYAIDNVYKFDRNIDIEKPTTYYVIDYTISKSDSRFNEIGRFGPLSVYRFSDL